MINTPVELITEFKEKLIKCDEINETTKIVNFIYQNCIDGFESIKLSEEEILESKKIKKCLNNIEKNIK